MKAKSAKKIIMISMILAVLSLDCTISNAESFKVIIDPGHGGEDNGSAHYGYMEDNLNLQIANRVKEKLIQEGISVEVTRKDDSYITLSERANMSNNSDADLFISIHQNAALNPLARGVETYYMGDKNQSLANDIQSGIVDYTEAKKRGIKEKSLYVLRNNTKPSILVECGFIANPNEAYLLSTSSYQNKVANGIVSGIKKHLNIDDKNTTNNTDNSVNKVIVVKADGLNVMSDRGKNFDVLGVLPVGTEVEVIDNKFDWYKIKYGDSYGYISGVYVSEKHVDITNNGSNKVKVVKPDGLKVMRDRGKNFDVLGILPVGTEVEVIDNEFDWYKIKYGDGYGYISGVYAKEEKSDITNTASNKIKVVKADGLKVMRDRGKNFDVLGILPVGTEVEVIDNKFDWYKIKYGDGYGYISGVYVK